MFASVKIRLLAVLVLAVSVAPVAASSILSVRPSTFAYATKTELVVVRGDRELAREKISFTKSYGGITWTQDGRYVAILTDEKPGVELRSEKRRLIVVDSESGKTRRLPCPLCSGLAAIGKDAILASQVTKDYSTHGFGLLRFDLSGSRPAVELATGVRGDVKGEENSNIKEARILAGVSGGALVGAFAEKCENRFLLLRSDSTFDGIGRRKIPAYGRNYGCYYGDGVVASKIASDGSPVFAVALVVNSVQNDCAARHEVLLLSLDGQGAVSTDLSALDPPGYQRGVETHVAVSDLWWDGAGRLHAIMYAGVCDGTDSMTTLPTEWLLEGNSWVQVTPEGIVAKRELNDVVNLVVTLRDRVNLVGTLFAEFPAGRRKLADDVVSVEIPQPRISYADASGRLQVRIKDICPREICVGVREGDVDADGRIDRIGLVLDKSSRVDSLELYVQLGNGLFVSGVVDTAKRPDRGWLGISDIDGDGRGDIVIDIGGVIAVKLVEGRLEVIRDYNKGELLMFADNQKREYNRFEFGGFTCERVDGHARVAKFRLTVYDDSVNVITGQEEVLEAGTDGVMNRVSVRQLKFDNDPSIGGGPHLPKEFEEKVGAHCPGLSRYRN
ncbi:FG-GAP repeat domain-containing protein [Nocardia sp. NPDC056611]|uniref:FG-GAP repeat domain-containing protein n=1 Tax=Nocardia sp. NPDC056611 TaxID=3345877 RepID=UPI00366EECD9